MFETRMFVSADGQLVQIGLDGVAGYAMVFNVTKGLVSGVTESDGSMVMFFGIFPCTKFDISNINFID